MAKTEVALVKTPYSKVNYTDQQIDEFMMCADPVTGPQYFMDNFFYIQHPTKGRMLYHPFEYQNDNQGWYRPGKIHSRNYCYRQNPYCIGTWERSQNLERKDRKARHSL